MTMYKILQIINNMFKIYYVKANMEKAMRLKLKDLCLK